jgi:hypothetical protein
MVQLKTDSTLKNKLKVLMLSANIEQNDGFSFIAKCAMNKEVKSK